MWYTIISLRIICTLFKGDNSLRIVCLPSAKGSALKGKNLCTRVDLFQRGFCTSEQTRSCKDYLPCEKMAENLPRVSSHRNNSVRHLLMLSLLGKNFSRWHFAIFIFLSCVASFPLSNFLRDALISFKVYKSLYHCKIQVKFDIGNHPPNFGCCGPFSTQYLLLG